MWRCTRNKIAQAARPALRELPVRPAKRQPELGNPTRGAKNLDEIDLRSLAEIQADGRVTNVELANRVGISPPPCLRRVRTLEEEGYIQGYRGLLDPRRLGFDVTVFASGHLSSQADAGLRAVLWGLAGSARARLRRHRVCLGAPVQPGGCGFACVRGFRPRRAVGAGMVDAVGGGGVHPQIRGPRAG